MLKLYKRSRSGIRYWEAWNYMGMVVVHEGRLGDRGKKRFLIPDDDQTPEQSIQEAARKPRSKGYAEIATVDQYQIVVQYRLKTWGSAEDLDKSHKIESLFNECLGWTGNGRCDGNDIGSGTLNIFSIVVDPELAAAELVKELRKNRLLRGAVVAVQEGEEYRVVYPARFKGKFSLI
jgi:hypothetical protein